MTILDADRRVAHAVALSSGRGRPALDGWNEGTHLAEATARAGLDFAEVDRRHERPIHRFALLKDPCTGLGSPNGTALLTEMRCRMMSLAIEPVGHGCVHTVQGGTAEWRAHLTGGGNPADVTFQWSVVGAVADSSMIHGAHFAIELPAGAGAFDLTVSVTVDGCTKSATVHVDPLAPEVAASIERLCDLFTDVEHHFVIDKLWDPLRDFIARPHCR